MPKFTVVENTPGYLPDSEPVECDDMTQAQEVASELEAELVEQGYRVVFKENTPDLVFITLERDERDLGRVIEAVPSEHDEG